MKSLDCSRTLAMLSLISCAVVAQPSLSAPVQVHIDAQPLDAALNAWAQQTGSSGLVPLERAAQGKSAPEVIGTYTPESALKILLASSDLRYEFISSNAVSIQTPVSQPVAYAVASDSSSEERSAADGAAPVQLASASTSA